jgi:hypothetical protein
MTERTAAMRASARKSISFGMSFGEWKGEGACEQAGHYLDVLLVSLEKTL